MKFIYRSGARKGRRKTIQEKHRYGGIYRARRIKYDWVKSIRHKFSFL